MDQRTDAELCQAVRAGDVDAFDTLYRRYIGWAREVTRRWVGAAEADDVVAEVFASVLAALRRGSGPTGAIRPYLKTALRHQVGGHLIPSDRERPSADLTAVVGAPTGLLDAPSAEDDVLARSEDEAAVRAFRTLRDRDRRVIDLVDLQGMSYREAADELGVETGSLGKTLHGARQALADAWVADQIPTQRGPEHPGELELARYVTGTAGVRSRGRTAAHLVECTSCTLRITALDAPAPDRRRRARLLGLVALPPVWWRLRHPHGRSLRPPLAVPVAVGSTLLLVGALAGSTPVTPFHAATAIGADPAAVSVGSTAATSPAPTITVDWEPGSTLHGVAAGEQVVLQFRIRATGDLDRSATLRIETAPGVTLDDGYRSCVAQGAALVCRGIGPFPDGGDLVGELVLRVDDPARAELPVLTVSR